MGNQTPLLWGGAGGRLPSTAHHRVYCHRPLCCVLQLQVDGHVVRQGLVLQRLDGLVMFQHLHRGDVRSVDVIGGQTIAALQQVHIFHVEFLNALAVELDGAALRYLNARHPFQDVTNDAVALLLVGTNGVVQRVAVLAYLIRFHRNLLQFYRFLSRADVNPLRLVRHHPRHIADGHARRCHYHGVCRAFELQLIISLRVRVRKADNAPRPFRRYRDVSIYRLSERVRHDALDNGLSMCRSQS